MSLYCFGKLKEVAARSGSYVFPPEVTFRHEIDPEDVEEIEKIEGLRGNGVFFSICDHPDSSDATGFWVEMMEKAPDRVLESRFGRTIHALLFDPHVPRGGIAFVDGGVEAILEGTRQQCWIWFLERAHKPWDTIGNPILIWSG
jgi:hypothetical protein